MRYIRSALIAALVINKTEHRVFLFIWTRYTANRIFSRCHKLPKNSSLIAKQEVCLWIENYKISWLQLTDAFQWKWNPGLILPRSCNLMIVWWGQNLFFYGVLLMAHTSQSFCTDNFYYFKQLTKPIRFVWGAFFTASILLIYHLDILVK